MKKYIITILVLTLLASAIGCSREQTAPSSTPENSVAEPAPEPSSEEESPDPSDNDNTEISVDHILMAIEAAYGEEYPPDGEIPAEVLESEFGLTPDLYVSAKGVMAMISMHNDRVVVVQAAEGKIDAVTQALEDARQRKIDDTLQYPMNIPKTNAAKVVTHGDFAAFLLVGRIDDSIEDVQSAEAKQHAEEEVQLAVDAFNGVFAD